VLFDNYTGTRIFYFNKSIFSVNYKLNYFLN